MMNAKNFKKMNDCDLDTVVGGTVAELEGLLKACYNNPHLQKFVGIGVHVLASGENRHRVSGEKRQF